MVIIRLSRGGSKRRPFYYIVVADKRSARDGRYIERIGFFNPIAAGKEEQVRIEDDRLQHWLNVGAQLSTRVAGIIQAQKAAA